jgi:hypothetical protein
VNEPRASSDQTVAGISIARELASKAAALLNPAVNRALISSTDQQMIWVRDKLILLRVSMKTPSHRCFDALPTSATATRKSSSVTIQVTGLPRPTKKAMPRARHATGLPRVQREQPGLA